MSRLVAALLLLAFKTSHALEPCQKLAVCALDKCITPSNGVFPPPDQLIDILLKKANFACIFGPACYQECSACESCKYAQDQIRKVVLREETDGQCPKLEACAKKCLDDAVVDPFGCVFRTRCANFCLDGADCQPCFETVKRVFTGYCYRGGFIEHYDRKCRPFFDELSAAYVRRR